MTRAGGQSDDDALAGVLGAMGDGVTVRVKVVPGASRTKVAGVLGDRLKLAVSAPPEGGKANRAVCALLGELFDVPPRNVVITAGQSKAQKTVALIGLSLCQATERLRTVLGKGG